MQAINQKNNLPFLAGLALLIAQLVSSFFIKLSAIPIRIWDEARNANNALYMHLNGHFLVPYYDGVPDMWNTKPPLLIWLQVLSIKVFGLNEWAIRFPSAVAAFTTGLLIYFFCKKLMRDPWRPLLAGSVFASTFAYVYNHAGRTGDYDALLILFSTAFSFSFYLFLQTGAKKYYQLFWVALTLAVLTKGIVALMLLPGLAIFCLLEKKIRAAVINWQFLAGLGILVLFAGGYYILREQNNPGYLQAVYENELGGRYFKTLEEHNYPFLFYVEGMFGFFNTYWVWFILPCFILGFTHGSSLIKKLTVFNLVMFLPFLLIISLAQTKLEWYVLPVYPFLAIQIAIGLYRCWEWIKTRFPRFPALAAFILVFAVPHIQVWNYIHQFKEMSWFDEPHRPGYFLKDAMKSGRELRGLVICYEGYNGQIRFYTDALSVRNIPVFLRQDVSGLRPGAEVLVCQETLEAALKREYEVVQRDEKWGCKLYLVRSRL